VHGSSVRQQVNLSLEVGDRFGNLRLSKVLFPAEVEYSSRELSNALFRRLVEVASAKQRFQLFEGSVEIAAAQLLRGRRKMYANVLRAGDGGAT
jgi:hypothetical protein